MTADALKILVVDDDKDAADGLAALLGLMGHDARCAYDGQQAVEAAQDLGPQMIIMDIQMPVMDGTEAARVMRTLSLQPTPLMIALTAVDAEPGDARLRDFDAYLRKPLDMQALSSFIPDGGNPAT